LPPERLVALTHCIRSAYRQGEVGEANLLFAERTRAVRQMVDDKVSLTEEEREAIRRADELLIATLNARKTEIAEQIRTVKVRERVKRAYVHR
jgi:hypothetical protein